MTYNPRRPLDDDAPDGYRESDRDYVLNNLELAVALLDKHGEAAPAAERIEFTKDDRVEATQAVGDVEMGDKGVIVAGWARANIGVRWDKDGKLRPVHRKRLRKVV